MIMNINRMCVILFVSLLFLFVGGCGKSDDQSTTKGTEGLVYEARDGSYTVVEYQGSEINVVIPDTYNDIPVTAVDRNVFSGSDIQSVIFGKNISSIAGSDVFDEGAFNNASLLTSISFSGDSVNIGIFAFNGCISLSSIHFPDGCYVYFDDYAFYECTSLIDLDFSNVDDHSVVGSTAFSRCDNLTDLYLPENGGIKDLHYAQFEHHEKSPINNLLYQCDACIHYGQKTADSSDLKTDSDVVQTQTIGGTKQDVFLPEIISLNYDDGDVDVLTFHYNDNGTIASIEENSEVVYTFSYDLNRRTVNVVWEEDFDDPLIVECDEQGRPKTCSLYSQMNDTEILSFSTENIYDDANRLSMIKGYYEIGSDWAGGSALCSYGYNNLGITEGVYLQYFDEEGVSDGKEELFDSLYSIISDLNENNGQLPDNLFATKLFGDGDVGITVQTVKQRNSSNYDLLNLFSLIDLSTFIIYTN